jgi:hypothetical protein
MGNAESTAMPNSNDFDQSQYSKIIKHQNSNNITTKAHRLIYGLIYIVLLSYSLIVVLFILQKKLGRIVNLEFFIQSSVSIITPGVSI